jgi:hypothetical protein
MDFQHKLIQIKIENLLVTSSDMSLEFILDPPDKPKPPSSSSSTSSSPSISSLSILHRLVTCIEMEILSMEIEFHFPALETVVRASTRMMTVHGALSEQDSHGLVAIIHFESNLVEILKLQHHNTHSDSFPSPPPSSPLSPSSSSSSCSEIILQYHGDTAFITVDINVPTMLMTVMMKLSCGGGGTATAAHQTTVHSQHFLNFFSSFQQAEDNSIELKLASGYATGGKLKKLHVMVEKMCVWVKDTRSPVMLMMMMTDLLVELQTIRNSSSYSQQTHPCRRWSDPLEECDLEKRIHVEVALIQFLGQETDCSVSLVNVTIVKAVHNTMADLFIDHETIEATIGMIHFEYLTNLFLDWLLILQNLSDQVPSSRFGHMKTGYVHALIQSINIALPPSDEIIFLNFKEEISRNILHLQLPQQQQRAQKEEEEQREEEQEASHRPSPFSSLPRLNQKLNRKFVRFVFDALEVTKTEDPLAQPLINEVNLSFSILDLVTNLQYSDLTDNYDLQLEHLTDKAVTVSECRGDDEDCEETNLSILYEIIDGQASFSLATEFQLHSVTLREVDLIENTYAFHQTHRHSAHAVLAPPPALHFDPMIAPVSTLLTYSHSRRRNLFQSHSIHINATPETMTVTTERLLGTIGFVSIIKCLTTVEMVTSTQKRITGKMDQMKEQEGTPPSASSYSLASTLFHLNSQPPLTNLLSIPPAVHELVPSTEPVEKRLILIFKSITVDLSLTAPSLPSPLPPPPPPMTSSLDSLPLPPLLLLLHCHLEEVKYTDQGDFTSFQFNRLSIFANHEDQNEFLVMTKFSFEKDLLKSWKRKYSPFFLPPHPTLGLGVNSQQTTQPVQRSVESTKVAMEEFMIHFHPKMNLSSTINAMLLQKDCYGAVTDKRKKKQTPPTVSDDTTHITTTQTSTLLTVDITRITFRVDAFYNQILYASFATFLWTDLSVHIENTLGEEEIQTKIRGMDTNSLRQMHYTSIQGGKTKISATELSLSFHLMSKRYLSGHHLLIEGDLFLATVSDERIVTLSNWTGLSDWHDDTPTSTSLSSPPPLIIIHGLVTDSAAPSKVYSNCTVTYTELELFDDVGTDPLMTAFLDAIDQSIPPNKDLYSPPLPWWDSIRYWTHGSVVFVINKLTYSVSRLITTSAPMSTLMGPPTCRATSTPLKLELTIYHLYLSVNRSLVELEGSDYLIHATYQENTSLATNTGPVSTRRRKNPSLSKKSLRTSKSFTHSAPITWRLCYVPSLSLSLAHTSSPTHSLLYDHHDIYLSPSHLYYKDRFYYFRMTKSCSRWGIHLSCPAALQNCMMLSLKLDVLQRILIAFGSTNPPPPSSTSSSPTTTPLSRGAAASAPPPSTPKRSSAPTPLHSPSSSSSQHPPPPQRRSSLMITQSPITSLPECISSVDIHLTLDNFLACSWPNSSNLHGIAFSQDLMRIDIRLSTPPPPSPPTLLNMSDSMSSSTSSSSSSLLLESIQGNVESMDVYVREWKVMGRPSSSIHRQQTNINTTISSQCLHVSDVVSLFEPRYKLAHASKVILKYEEESQHLRSSYERSYRKLSTELEPSPHLSTIPSPAPQPHRSSISSLSSVSLRDKIVFRPSVLSFRANHSALMPPSSSLPQRMRSQKRTSIHALDLISRPLQSHDKSAPHTRGGGGGGSHHEPFLPNQIWDLKVVDFRLLWTIHLRDLLTTFGGRVSEIFKTTNTKVDEPSPSSRPVSSSSQDEFDTKVASREFRRTASMDDSLLPSHTNSSLIHPTHTPPPLERAPRARSGAIIASPDGGIVGGGVDGGDEDGDMEHTLTISLPTNMRNRAMTKRQSGEIDLATYYLENNLSATSELSPRSSSPVGSGTSEKHSPLGIGGGGGSLALTTSQSKRKRRGNRRLSLRDKNLNVDDSLEYPEEGTGEPAPPLKLPLVPSPGTSGGASRSFHRSSSVDNSQLVPRSLAGVAGSGVVAHSSITHFQRFFSIELQDPQVNILDEKTQSTLLIVIDGSSTLIGKKHNGATVTVQGLGDQEKVSPKRKVNVRLKMENVNAYTIPTTATATGGGMSEVGGGGGGNSGTSIVHWKALHHTEVNQQQTRLKSTLRQHKRTETTEKFVHAEDLLLSKQTPPSPDSVPVSAPGGSSSTNPSSSTLLRNAINNFAMMSVYTYYEDLTVEEAAQLYTHRTREELMNSFMLDLPQVCLKVDSLQFSILLNTIRNVLLAPPPVQAEGGGGGVTDTNGSHDGEERRGILRLDSAVDGGGVVPSLDNRVGRTQIRNLVEQNLLTLPENEFCTAQSIEYFVGRGTWQMCSPNSDDILLEVGFMGLFGSHSFHEDRYEILSRLALFSVSLSICLSHTLLTPPPQVILHNLRSSAFLGSRHT